MSNGDKCQQLTWVSKVNKEGFFFFWRKGKPKYREEKERKENELKKVYTETQ